MIPLQLCMSQHAVLPAVVHQVWRDDRTVDVLPVEGVQQGGRTVDTARELHGRRGEGRGGERRGEEGEGERRGEREWEGWGGREGEGRGGRGGEGKGRACTSHTTFFHLLFPCWTMLLKFFFQTANYEKSDGW